MHPQPLKTSPQYVVSVWYAPRIDDAHLDVYGCASVVCSNKEVVTHCLDVIRRSRYYRHAITHLKYAGFILSGQPLTSLVHGNDYWFQVQCTDRGIHGVVCGCGPLMLWHADKRIRFDNLDYYESIVGVVELSYMI